MNAAGLPEICDVALMPVSAEWLPYESMVERQLLRQAVEDQRHLVKALRVDLPRERPIASLLLTDSVPPCAMHVHCATGDDEHDAARALVMTVPGVTHAEWTPGSPLPGR